MSPLDPDSRTAVYDISARRVYLPNGEKLEAHSGLGDKRDDPQYVHVRMRGPTPPNVYDLTLREKRFHGVRAIRLNPVDDSKMFGRDGILAHSYMLGSNGQSNGCVSFKNYKKFLQAFLSGEVDRTCRCVQSWERAFAHRPRSACSGAVAAPLIVLPTDPLIGPAQYADALATSGNSTQAFHGSGRRQLVQNTIG